MLRWKNLSPLKLNNPTDDLIQMAKYFNQSQAPNNNNMKNALAKGLYYKTFFGRNLRIFEIN